MYLPVRVSIFSFSPVLMNSGAWTVMPVSMVTAFCTLLAESPRMPSGASVTPRMTLDGSSTWTAFLVLFVVGWALQFLGHHYEGKRPALLDNLFQAFIGPMFLVAETLVASGYRADLALAMGEGDVTAR